MSARHRVNVWHDSEGRIAAVGRSLTGDVTVVPLAGGALEVLEVEVPEGAAAQLHTTHRVDVGRRELVSISGEKKTTS